MHPAALVAAAELGFADIRVLTAWDGGSEPRRLVGLWALQRVRRLPFLPPILSAAPYDYAFVCRPVIDPAVAEEVASAFFAALAADPALPGVIALPEVNTDSEAFQALARAAVAGGHPLVTLTTAVRPTASREVGVKASGSTRKKLRQDWNRLSALGQAEVVCHRSRQAVAEALEVFLAMEAASWKGDSGTALLCNARDAAFARRLIVDLAAAGAASVTLLMLDGRAIAEQVLLHCGGTVYTWKMAFDAEFAKYSPGVLLVDKITASWLAEDGITELDSCSSEDGFMGRIWTGRQPLADVLIGAGRRRSAAFLLELARWRAYERLRQWRNALRARGWLSSNRTRAGTVRSL
jgi:CelD/BcsL family acetyltransferase involved in cellulose biosynthesis